MSEEINVKIICPSCKTSKSLPIKRSIVKQSMQLTTISIPAGMICEHHFQAFVDKNFKVRGYQNVDYAFESENAPKALVENEPDAWFDNGFNRFTERSGTMASDLDAFSWLPEKKEVKLKTTEPKREKTLKEIYEEFWHIIDDNDETFREFIINDVRRTSI